jgi:hypothetical protein
MVDYNIKIKPKKDESNIKMDEKKIGKNNMWKRPLRKIMDEMKAKLFSSVLCLLPNWILIILSLIWVNVTNCVLVWN